MLEAEFGLYRSDFEHDACGVGVVVGIDSGARRDIIEMAIEALRAISHRGAVDSDGKSGDGAGMHIAVPEQFFQDAIKLMGHNLLDSPIAVGHIFLPRTDLAQQEICRTIVEAELINFGFYIYGWRQVPIDTTVIGPKADNYRPEIEQVIFTKKPLIDQKNIS